MAKFPDGPAQLIESGTEINIYEFTGRSVSLLQNIPLPFSNRIDVNGDGIEDLILGTVDLKVKEVWLCLLVGCSKYSSLNSGIDSSLIKYNGFAQSSNTNFVDLYGWSGSNLLTFTHSSSGTYGAQNLVLTDPVGSYKSTTGSGVVGYRLGFELGGTLVRYNFATISNGVLIGVESRLEDCLAGQDLHIRQNLDINNYPEFSCISTDGSFLNRISNGESFYGTQSQRKLPVKFSKLGLEDFDSDNLNEYFGFSDDGIFHIINNDESLSPKFTIALESNYTLVDFSDYDLDGRLDFYFVNPTEGKMKFVRNILAK